MRTLQDIFSEVEKQISDAKVNEPPAGDKNTDPKRLEPLPEGVEVATTVYRRAWRGSLEHPEIENEILEIQRREVELSSIMEQVIDPNQEFQGKETTTPIQE